ncbi:MAG: undecaprenyl-phosphate glucose phosphotransferase [Prevotella sp.]|nr:undecaprenyl-phosphate glucose phosphotransferase [Prevotella sp.]
MNTAIKKAFKLNAAVTLFDLLTFNVICLMSYYANLWPYGSNRNAVSWDWIIANICYCVALYMVRISFHRRMSTPARIIRNVASTTIFFVIFYDAVLGMAHMVVPGYWRSLSMLAVIFVVICIERLSVRKLLYAYRSHGGNVSYVMIVGWGYATKRVIEYMKQPLNGYWVRGLFYDKEVTKEESGVNYLGKVDEAFDYLKENDINEVYIGLANDDDERMRPLVEYCQLNMIKVYYIPQTHSTKEHHTVPIEFGQTFVMALYNEPLMSYKNRFIKRAFDIVFSTLFLCTLFPIIYIVVAIITKIKMPGPVFFKQARTGFDGKDFICYKFRSMKMNSDADKKQATKDDPRITKWGAFLRHSSIDELPQFINVFKGDMSVVGPRPHMLAHTEYYSKRISDYMVRHYVKPGVTGWAQTHGSRGETKELSDMVDRVEKDIWYMEHWSFWLDIQIIIKTVKNAIQGDEQAF